MSEYSPDTAFVKALKEGDPVSVYDSIRGYIHDGTIKRITPTGLIRIDDLHVFRANGWLRDPVYYGRFIGPRRKP